MSTPAPQHRIRCLFASYLMAEIELDLKDFDESLGEAIETANERGPWSEHQHGPIFIESIERAGDGTSIEVPRKFAEPATWGHRWEADGERNGAEQYRCATDEGVNESPVCPPEELVWFEPEANGVSGHAPGFYCETCLSEWNCAPAPDAPTLAEILTRQRRPE